MDKIYTNPNISTPCASAEVFNDAFCDEIIEMIDDNAWEEGYVNNHNEELHVDHTVRQCLQQSCPNDPKRNFPLAWITKIVANLNKDIWKFDLYGLNPQLDVPVILKYHAAKQDFYDWHVDYFPDQCTRKLSFVLQLSSEDDYEGGGLRFFPNKDIEVPRKRGSMIVFPCHVPHKVEPVTKGTRLALVGWVHGPSYR
ncbi:MAG: hypothetical protein GWP59_04020 [Chlamydiales bacterium]|nr:hypothetical protein [Chlamydiales bacterium]